ncbi:MAG: AI-2E family transporter [Clostridiales bacterium]|nr:AI-2E family transporter [Clostridiales bacterium]
MNDLERYNRDKASVMSMLKFILAVGITVGLLYVGKIVAIILIPFLIGFLLAKTSDIIAKPLSKLFDKDAKKIRPGRRKSTHTKTALVIYVILNIFVFIIIVLTFIGLVYQANSLLVALADAAKSFKPSELFSTHILDRFSEANGGFLTEDMMDSVQSSIADMGQTLAKNIPTFVSGAFSKLWKLVGNLPYGVFVVICVILSGFYFINDAPAVLKFYVRNTPNKTFRNRIFTLLNELAVMVFRVLGGYLALFIITAFESLIVFWVAGLHEYAIVLCIITALIDFLPILGISATMIPMIIYQICNGNYVSAGVLLAGFIVMSIIRRFIEPAILGKSLKMHPLITLLAMAAGVYVWGAVGFLLGPVLAIIIIQVIKVFEIDKMVGRYLSGILDGFMTSKDDKNKKGSKSDKAGPSEDAVSEEESPAEEAAEEAEKAAPKKAGKAPKKK